MRLGLSIAYRAVTSFIVTDGIFPPVKTFPNPTILNDFNKQNADFLEIFFTT